MGSLDREQTIRSLTVCRKILERVRADAPPDLLAACDGFVELGDAARKLIELIEAVEADHKAAQGRLL